MVKRSDFVRENVELDENWEPKRRHGFFERSTGGRDDPSRPASQRATDPDSARWLGEAIVRNLSLLLRILFLLGIFVMAFRSLKPHGGFIDFLIWLAVGIYFFRTSRR